MAWRNKQQGFSPDDLCEALDLLWDNHQTGLPIMPEGQASRAHAPKASTTTLGEWCQQGCPAHLLRRNAAAVKGESTAPKSQDKHKAKEDKEAIKEKAESLQQVLDDLPDASPLRPDFEASCKACRGSSKTKEARGPGWTLPKHGFAEPKLPGKKEQAMEDAAKALEEAKQEAEEAQKALEEVRATMHGSQHGG